MAAKTRRKYEGGAVSTTITSNLGNAVGDTSISVAAATGWPSAGPFYVVVDPGTASEEKMLVGTISGTALSSLTRGVDGTTRVSHSSGATIYPVFTAVDADEANELTSKYTTRGDIVYQGASTFETLAKGAEHTVLKAGANDPAWGLVTNDNVDASAAIVDTKLATISTANKVSVAALDIDGATDIGADLVDADLVIVDDGAGGTNRKSAISRFAKYLFGKVSGDVTVTEAGVATVANAGFGRITGCTVSSVGGTSATASNGVITIGNGNTSVTVSNAFSETYSNYLIIIDYALATTGNPGLYMKMGTTASGYYGATSYYSYDGLADGVARRNNETEWNVGYVGANNLSASITVYAPQRNVRTSVSSMFAGDLYYGTANGMLANTTQYTAFNLAPASSSFAGGTIRVYGYTK